MMKSCVVCKLIFTFWNNKHDNYYDVKKTIVYKNLEAYEEDSKMNFLGTQDCILYILERDTLEHVSCEIIDDEGFIIDDSE